MLAFVPEVPFEAVTPSVVNACKTVFGGIHPVARIVKHSQYYDQSVTRFPWFQ